MAHFLPTDTDMPDFLATANYANSILHPGPNQALETLPPAWAKHRNDLAESLDFFQCRRGNVYISNDVVLGCLFDHDSGERTYLDSEVVIAKIGSSAEAPGGARYRPQRTNLGLKLRAWQRTKELGASVVVILARSYPNLPIQLPEDYRYVVLENFRISELWAERDDGNNVAYMARLEKCNLEARSWWTPNQGDPPEYRDHRVSQGALNPVPVVTCESCAHVSSRVYAEVWLCLNASCDFFFTRNDAMRSPPPAALSFNPPFLFQRSFDRTYPDHFKPSYALCPDLVGSLRAIENSGQIVAQLGMLWKGVICPQCHALIPKMYWHLWACTECDGGFNVHFNPGLIMLRALIPRTLVSYVGHPPVEAKWPKDDVQHQGPIFKEYYRVDKWVLHGGSRLILLSPSAAFNENPDGPDTIFNQLLTDANEGKLGLHRNQLSEIAENLSHHFEANYGAGYSFSSHPNISFSTAEFSVRCAAYLVDKICREELRGQYVVPNTVQVMGYLPGMSLPWHTDGGEELNATVSTLSLGADATFRLRLQERYYGNTDVFGSGGEVIQGAKNWRKVAEMKAVLDAGVEPDVVSTNFFKQTKGDIHQGRKSRPEIVLPLIHGSIVIMQGTAIAKYYEHCLEPQGGLTFTVTGRNVDQLRRQELYAAAPLRRTTGQIFMPEDGVVIDDEPDDEESPIMATVPMVARPEPADLDVATGRRDSRSHRTRSPTPRSRENPAPEPGRATRRVRTRVSQRLAGRSSVVHDDGLGDMDVDDDGDEEPPARTRSASPVRGGRDRSSRTAATPQLRAGRKSAVSWTRAETDRLFALRTAGMSFEEVARRLGTGRPAGSCRAQMLLERNRRADEASADNSFATSTPDTGTPRTSSMDPAPQAVPTVASLAGAGPALGGAMVASAPGDDRTIRTIRGHYRSPYHIVWDQWELDLLIHMRDNQRESYANIVATINARQENVDRNVTRTADACRSRYTKLQRDAKKGKEKNKYGKGKAGRPRKSSDPPPIDPLLGRKEDDDDDEGGGGLSNRGATGSSSDPKPGYSSTISQPTTRSTRHRRGA